MEKHKVFVDGAVGTTGLRINERLAGQPDIELLTLPDEWRKNLGARLSAVASADLTILCLPDDAARELVAAAPSDAKICDASTAHRVQQGWAYGLPELAGRRETIQQAARVAVPGCHASGFLALVAPLVEMELLPADAPLSCHSLTGYSGGGKAMIAAYTAVDRPPEYDAPRQYGLSLRHKHLPEMQKVAGLSAPPLFTPVVADYYSGMLVTVPLPAQKLPKDWRSPGRVAAFFQDYYAGEAMITVKALQGAPADGFLSAVSMAGRDDMELYVLGNDSQILLAARFDNLGKGAAGAAVQCANLMLGRAETAGLRLEGTDNI